MDRATQTSALVARLRDALASVDGVRVAYLFGSRARGNARADSDIDVAVEFDRALDATARHDAYLDVIARAEDAASLSVLVDVVDLRRTDSAVAFRAITEGSLILARTPGERVAVEVFVGRNYDDDAYKRRLFEAAARRVAARWAAHG